MALRGCHLSGTSWGGWSRGGSPGLLLTLVTHMCPGWVAQGVLDGGTGWARWHLGAVGCLAPLLQGGLRVPPGLPPVTHVGGTDYVPGAQDTLGIGHAPGEAPPAHPAWDVTPAQAPHSHWGSAGSKWGGGSCSGVRRPRSSPQAVLGGGALTGGPSLTSRISSAPPARSVVGSGGGTGHVPARCPQH